MCARPIPVGMLYATWSCFSDDGVARVNAHRTCVEIGSMIDLTDSDWEGAPPLSDVEASDIWRWADEGDLDLQEIEAVWGTREDAEAEAERRRTEFWKLRGF